MDEFFLNFFHFTMEHYTIAKKKRQRMSEKIYERER
jgi:hypothetical protein